MTLEELVRCHRELMLIMGHGEARHGPKVTYGYEAFTADLNAVKADIVRNVQQMKDVMRGKTQPPQSWQTACDELLHLAVSGESNPPQRGPMWTPIPLTKHRRKLAATRLDEWLVERRTTPHKLGMAAQVSRNRIKRIRAQETPITPTELDRLAAALNVSVEEFLRGPFKVEGVQFYD